MFDLVPGVFAFATLVIVIFIAEASGRKRSPKVTRVVVVQPEAANDPEPQENPEDVEVRHWTAQGLHKLGYSMTEARRMAAQVPPGYGLQDALQWCLRKQGGRK